MEVDIRGLSMLEPGSQSLVYKFCFVLIKTVLRCPKRKNRVYSLGPDSCINKWKVLSPYLNPFPSHFLTFYPTPVVSCI